MLPQTQQRKPRNSSKVNLLISVGFHAIIAGAVIYFAAREGLLGKSLKKIAVEMVKEKPLEKPKEPEKPKEQPKIAEESKAAPKMDVPKEVVQTAPPPSAAPPSIAPAAADVASFNFEGGKAVETSSDPIQLYKGLLQYALQSKWDRPEDMDDHNFAAEIEISVDRQGGISDPVWKKSSNNKRWDDSVRQALAMTRSVNRPPPSNFPPRVIVRFDVVQAEAIQP
jgi:hypothetical protein